MLGYAAPPITLRDAAASPELPVPSLGPDHNAGAEAQDQLSEMVLEGYRTGPAQPLPEPDGDWREPSAIHSETASRDHAASQDPPPAHAPQGWMTAPASPTAPVADAARPRSRALWIVAGMVGAAVIGVAAWQVYTRLIVPPTGSIGRITSRPSEPHVVAPPDDGAIIAGASDDAEASAPADATQAAVGLADAAQVARGPGDARTASGAPADAAQVATIRPAVPTAPGDSLSIASTPPGARVFLDGADAGTTPLKLPGSPDRHTIALLLASHELYVVQVDGHGTFQVPLKEVTPSNGPAGIKVLRCKDKDRYYVFVDGKPTGQTCPTERIGCEVGPHTVEVYDVVSETRRKWDIVVKDTRLSFRVRVE
jgi:hypothetical protein